MDIKKAFSFFLGLGLVAFVAWGLAIGFPRFLAGRQNSRAPQQSAQVPSDPFNIAYTIDGTQYLFLNGISQRPVASGSQAMETVRVFGAPAYGDLDNDGVQDAAVFLQREAGGSGVFYYLAAALNVQGKYLGLDAVFLGDRIAPQTVEVRNGVVTANYADRKPNEPMSAQPSVGTSVFARVENGKLAKIPYAEARQLLEGN